MKKILIVVMCLAFISANAQDKKWTFRADVGLSLSKVTTQVDNGSSVGVVVFLGGQYQINDYIGLQSGVQYGHTPVKFKYVDFSTTSPSTYDYKVKYHRLSIPVLVKGYLMPTNKLGLNLFAGPQVDFALKEDGSTNGYAADFDEVTRGVTLSGVIGVGYDFKCGLALSLSQTFGITGVNKAIDGKYPANFPNTSKLNYLSLRVGWRF
ncbi:MAG: PorT family protein [Flavobacteriales bacterium]|nr:PorT family protein [Flavobacteriales bacterium]